MFVFRLPAAGFGDMNEIVFFHDCDTKAASDGTYAHLLQNNSTTESRGPEARTQLMQ